ncbi:MAG: hypothetical protein ACYC57_05215 [Thermoleophilia bacterium]
MQAFLKEFFRRKFLALSILASLVGLITILLIVWYSAVETSNAIDQIESEDWEKYFNQIAIILEESDSSGKRITTILSSETISADELSQLIEQEAITSFEILDEVRGIRPPDDLKETHNMLINCVEQRHDGVNGLNSLLAEQVPLDDTKSYADRFETELLTLLSGDVLYQDFYYESSIRMIGTRGYAIEVPQSVFVSDPYIASEENVVSIIEKLK